MLFDVYETEDGQKYFFNIEDPEISERLQQFSSIYPDSRYVYSEFVTDCKENC
ncbi:MAG: hypothetical protein HN826_15900 [Methylococcales bacterium]|nr:hypothetical protein [Methylococcales bacterium]